MIVLTRDQAENLASILDRLTDRLADLTALMGLSTHGTIEGGMATHSWPVVEGGNLSPSFHEHPLHPAYVDVANARAQTYLVLVPCLDHDVVVRWCPTDPLPTRVVCEYHVKVVDAWVEVWEDDRDRQLTRITQALSRDDTITTAVKSDLIGREADDREDEQ